MTESRKGYYFLFSGSKNAKKMIVDGVEFDSFVSVANHFGVDNACIRYHLKTHGHYKGHKIEYKIECKEGERVERISKGDRGTLQKTRSVDDTCICDQEN